MSQSNRLQGGMIDRSREIAFTFDGKAYRGHPGDTLASALLANGVRLMGRSFKYHRPRGVLSSGSEEPNALVTIRAGARAEPNTRATVAELFEGLEATSQNRWPGLAFDAMAVNDFASPFLTAGFYYKTFMWPRSFWEKLYEPAIRRAAGLGKLSEKPDPDAYDRAYLHCDLLVVGSGPAGLAAALTAGRAGVRVILADEDFVMGGRLLAEQGLLDSDEGQNWLAAILDELGNLPNVRLMTRTTVYGSYDHGIYGALERNADHLSERASGKPRQTLWRIYSRRTVLCAGATERPVAFPSNDRPGILLAGALRAYVNRWAATPARDVVLFTSTDDGHRVALDLIAKGLNVKAVVDPRQDIEALGDYELHSGSEIVNTRGRLGLNEVTVRGKNNTEFNIECGALGMSAGWNPNVHLTCHQRGRPVWNEELAAFVPGGTLPVGMSVAGAAAGEFSTHGALLSGAAAASAALGELGVRAKTPELPKAEDGPIAQNAYWYVKEVTGRAWLDQQNDVTVKDVKLAHQEGFKSVEHLKRYTTLGMATDQGKTANIAALAIMAELEGRTIAETGTTIFRPPYTPVPIASFAGRAREKSFRPTRLTPSHHWAVEQGAPFIEAGLWLRAQYYPRPGETHWRQSADREAIAVRSAVGVCDVSTLGKIDVQGADAAEFLNRLYCNAFLKLPVGKVRYGLMLREDGIVMDDGTAARFAEDHFVVTTTTAHAGPVYRHMEFARQCLWPDLDVQIISTTDAWAQFAVAGPRSRELLGRIVDASHDITNEGFPFMACAPVTVCGGLKGRLFRISFSGELAYEIAVPTRYGDALIRRLMEKGADLGVTPYGMEALDILRIEKGHLTGNELNGQTTAAMIGMGRMVSDKKDSIGAVLSRREGLVSDDRRLVGLKAVDAGQGFAAGSHLMNATGPVDAAHDQGWVTSACHSPHVGSRIGLAILKGGDTRLGEIIRAVNPIEGQEALVEVVSPHFIDPQGDRLHA
jgi:heterotetrameric sarcosine oxidase alpha subunit